MNFNDLDYNNNIYLYAGNYPNKKTDLKLPFVGLSLDRNDQNHITHDVTHTMPIPDECVDVYLSEHVFEHIEYDQLPKTINEIYRVLKPGGLFRLSIPDYRMPYMQKRSYKDKDGNIIFDKKTGGKFNRKTNTVIIPCRHVWFPMYETTKTLLDNSKFTNINFLQYYDTNGNSVVSPIDYTKGYLIRTAENDPRAEGKAFSIVVDCVK